MKNLIKSLENAIDENNHDEVSRILSITLPMIRSISSDDKKELMSSLSSYDGFGNTPLHLAAYKGNPEIVSHILSAFGGDKKWLLELLEIKDKRGYTPLHVAAIQDHTEIVSKILSAVGYDKEALKTLLLIDTNQSSILKLPRDTLLKCFAGKGHTEIVSKILSAFGEDKKGLMVLLLSKGRDGNTTLHLAASNGHTEIVSHILSAVGDDKKGLMALLSSKDQFGNTPLHLAIINGRTDIVFKIFSAFGDYKEGLMVLLKIKDGDGYTPLHVAAYQGHVEILKMIINQLDPKVALELFFEINSKGRNLNAEVFLKSKVDNTQVLQLLSSMGADSSSMYCTVSDQDKIEWRTQEFASAAHIVAVTDTLRRSIPDKFRHKVIDLQTKENIENAIEKAIIDNPIIDNTINKAVIDINILNTDIIHNVFAGYVLTTVERLQLAKSLRQVPFYGNEQIFNEILYKAARLLRINSRLGLLSIKHGHNPAGVDTRELCKDNIFDLSVIQFTYNADHDKALIDFVGKMLVIDREHGESDIAASFREMYYKRMISKDSVIELSTRYNSSEHAPSKDQKAALELFAEAFQNDGVYVREAVNQLPSATDLAAPAAPAPLSAAQEEAPATAEQQQPMGRG